MKGVLTDTGPLYAAYDSSDSYHSEAQQSLIILAERSLPVVLIYPVLLECHNLLLKRFGTAIGLRFLQEMKTGTLIINPDSVDYDRAIQMLQTYRDQRITLCDATIAIVSQRLKLPIWSYDFHFDVMRSQRWQG
ncbi:MAG: type II toxin-antitoxin system VapC family toxin [Prochlorotrichaceae cyanobacterium]|jgi:predicted nucleic acid-binding protein